ncbi:MAG: kinase/pyrophosphorylase [Coriobacteriia bacterium]|nr:kinase/pyrophosphorylase [Coriobacteriia bacterium]
MTCDSPATIYILSDSLGETADLVARAAASQFSRGTFELVRLAKVSSAGSLEELVRAASNPGCVFFYTLADPALRERMDAVVAELGVTAVDILGTAVEALSRASDIAPTGEVGAIRKTDRGYFQRIEAMEFAVKHDDGRNPEDLSEAEVVLIGASRTSKTPLSMYLAFKGYKTANIPLMTEVDPPAELFQVNPRRVFGLTSDPDLLASIRSKRLTELGTYARHYAEREAVVRDLESARALMRQLGCVVVWTGNRAVEETAQEIIRYLEQ